MPLREYRAIEKQPGILRILYSCGKPSDWIDREHAFGSNSEYCRMDTVFTPQAGYAYEITLYGVSDGSITSTQIANPYQ